MEAPYLQKVFQLGRQRGAMVVGMAVPGDEVASLKDFRKQHRVNYPIALDVHNGLYDRVDRPFPVTVLVDRTGVIRYIEEGFDPGAFAATQARFLRLQAPVRPPARPRGGR